MIQSFLVDAACFLDFPTSSVSQIMIATFKDDSPARRTCIYQVCPMDHQLLTRAQTVAFPNKDAGDQGLRFACILLI